MKRTIPFMLNALHFLALAVWLGGLITLWLALMPAAFGGAGLTIREAEAVTGETLRRFAPLVEICGLAMLGAQIGIRITRGRVRQAFPIEAVRLILTFCALLLAEICLRSVLPRMNIARQVVHVAEFHHLHQSYSALATLETVLLIGVSLLTAWLQQPRSTKTEDKTS